MKRAILAILTAAVILGTTGCAFDFEISSKKAISSAESKSNDKDKSGGNAESSSESKAAETTEAPADVFTIAEQVLWEVDGVKITATGIEEDSFFGPEIKVLIENNSDKDVGIGADTIIVNDYMISDLMSSTVTAGNKLNDTIALSASELEAAGIDAIGKIELYLHTFDPESYSTLKESECITISTSAADKIDTENSLTGTTLYEQNGVKIVGLYTDENSFWGSAVVLYIENNTDKNIIVGCDDVAVNGFMITSLLSEDVNAGKKAIGDITLSSSSLEENGITSIGEIETSFSIMDENFHEIANSGKIKFK